MPSPTTAFYVIEEKTIKLINLLICFSFLSKGYFVGFITHSSEVRVSGKSAIYYIIPVCFSL